VALEARPVAQIGVLAAISIGEVRNSLEVLVAVALTATPVEAILAVERVVAAVADFLVDAGAEAAHPRRVVEGPAEPASPGLGTMPNHAPRILAGARICY